MATAISLNAKSITLDPVSRVEGHLKIEVTADMVGGVLSVVDAKASGTLFRGFEKILVNRNPLDAPDITQRICGVCPVSHALAATSALEAAAGTVVPTNARILRNLVLGANYLQSHILHFYVLSLLDFVDGPNMPPWTPTSGGERRITGATAATLVNNYVRALDIRSKCHEMGALFGGKLPHPPAFVAGGFTTTPRQDRITKFGLYLDEIIAFIEGVYAPDVNLIATTYSDYRKIGSGSKNLLAYGVFDLDDAGKTKLLGRGYAVKGTATILPVDPKAITENVAFAWYDNKTNNLNPASGDTVPVHPKNGAYTWLKAPRYRSATNAIACETGPLARMWVNGDYRDGISVIDRHLARFQETRKVAYALRDWIHQLNSSGPIYRDFTVPSAGAGIGWTEAPRGALGHWVKISNARISNYQVITPTCWNASPIDDKGVRGPIEQALIGTPVANPAEPIEVVRVIHSFDPCLACAVHVMRPAGNARIFALGQVPC